MDNLTGFVDAIQAIYPKTDVQLCIVHHRRRQPRSEIRNSKKYLSYNDTLRA